MTTRAEFKASVKYDEERQRAYMWTAILVWILIGLFLVFRDPVWRTLHEGELVGGIAPTTRGWTELDKSLMKRLSDPDVERVAGVESLEESLVSRIDRRRQEGAAEGEQPPKPIETAEELTKRARARAKTRLGLDPAAEIRSPELLYPETYFALAMPDRLVHTVEVNQKLPASAPLGDPAFHDELVGGWLNRTRFRTAVMQSQDLRIGVGAVTGESGETMIEVVLEETFAVLAAPLPPIVGEGDSLEIAGSRLGDNDLVLYFKGPSDPGFYPIDPTWTAGDFALTPAWDQGPGIYALRAGRLDRLSDPRPILVD